MSFPSGSSRQLGKSAIRRWGWGDNHFLQPAYILSLILLLFVSFGLAWSQDVEAAEELEAAEEEEVVVAVQFAVNQARFTDEQFDQWVFQQQGTAKAARQRMDEQLKLQAEDINRVCGLTEAQVKKLGLAGRGDIKKFFDRYEQVKQKFQKLKNDQQKFNQIWQDINPLQMTLQAGLFHGNSFLYKTIRNTLDDEQYARYEKVARERRVYRHRAKVELTVAVLEQGMPLMQEQREKLISVLEQKTKPSKSPGQYDYYIIMYQLSRLPKEELKPLLDDVQWKVFSRQLDQARGMGQWLKQSGQLPDEDEDKQDKQQ